MQCPVFKDGLTYCLMERCTFYNTAVAACDYSKLIDMRKDAERKAYIEQNRQDHMATEKG